MLGWSSRLRATLCRIVAASHIHSVLCGARTGLRMDTYIEVRLFYLRKCTRTTGAEHRLMQAQVFPLQFIESKHQRDRTEQTDSGLTALQKDDDATLACLLACWLARGNNSSNAVSMQSTRLGQRSFEQTSSTACVGFQPSGNGQVI